ncbi:MAG: carboxypeptidase regulatory-like domain-containing protein [Planctomycetota bacterium]|nr:carboxypeptidase regulatory-like domain-containing protein [Planctomycetota bacterium]
MKTNLTESQRRERSRTRLLCLIVGCFMICAGTLALGGYQLAQEHYRREDYLTAKARELGFDPARIQAYVRKEVAAEAYPGMLRGALGTLWSGAGNDLDRALLLQALLERSGVPARLVRGRTWGVETGSEGDYRYAGPALEADPGEVPAANLAAEAHRVEGLLRTVPASGPAVEEAFAFDAAEAVGQDLALVYRAEGTRVFATLRGAGVLLESAADARTAQRQEVVFRFRAPDGEVTERVRELFDAHYRDFPSFFHPDNRYTFTLSAGWIPESVFEREQERAREEMPGDAGLAHTIAYAFLSRSDAHARELKERLQAEAWFSAPRLTVVAAEYHQRDGKRTRSVSIDLRKNDLRANGSDEIRVAFGSARSLFDASLESAVLAQFTGANAVSSMDLLAQAMQRRNATLAERQSLLQRSLARLFKEAREGATLRLAPEGRPDFSVTFTREAQGLRAEASAAVRQGLDGLEGNGWILARPSFGEGEIETAARETEVALALSARLPMQYEPVYEYTEVPGERWYENARIFSFSGDRLNFEIQNLSVRPDRVVESVDYYDDIKNEWLAYPRRATRKTSAEDMDHARAFTYWYMNRKGTTIDMLSRDAFREIKEKGSTVLRYVYNDGKESEPVRLFASKRQEREIVINNTPRKIGVVYLYGHYDRTIKPGMSEAEIRKLGLILDPSGAPINALTLLDDPEFPMVANFSRVQSAIPGRVTDAATGRGIADATVTIVGPYAKALSWADGRFSIPVIKEPFKEFQVQVTAPGYRSIRTLIDFRKADAFPLNLKLEAEPRAPKEAFVRVDPASAASVLPGLKLSPRSKDLIAEALRANDDLTVMVPTFEVSGTYGPMEAWYEIDTKTGDCYGRLDDGLYGATDRPYWAQHAAVSYFSGRIASWYLFAAGALDGVAQNIDHPEMTLADLHKHASRTAREMAKIYDGFWFGLMAGRVANMKAFKKGLTDGLAWADDYYAKAWGVR